MITAAWSDSQSLSSSSGQGRGVPLTATYTAFREVGRVIRNVQLLRYLSAAPLRRRAPRPQTWSTRSTASPSGSASATVAPTDNDPVEQEKTAKFNALLTNAVIFHNAPDIAEIVRQLQEEGNVVDPEDLPTSRRT
ncbi:transposase [Streptomyces sp. NBC_00879]|uniref:Tn3 family transposase n=1 Tax=Streptomyces sp. NBC_00879 TaxID=2975855 RepID=UPI00386D5D19|nr:transposase [Streptomyces sp. NBC_00879]